MTKAQKLLSRLKNNTGFSYVFVAVLLVIAMILTSAVFEVIRINTICANVREKFQDSLVSVLTDNYDSLFSTGRDGYTATYSYNGSSWSNSNNVSAPKIASEVMNALNSGEKKQVNSISNIRFTVTQTFRSSGSRFHVEGSCTANIPFMFAFAGDFNFTINADTEWVARF